MNVQSPQDGVNPPTLRKGDRGSAVVQLQKQLINWGCYKGQLTGIFDETVEQAVLRFQFQFFLQEDGIVGSQTWQVLNSGIPTNLPVLSPGSRGREVVNLQEVLTISGHYQGSITGQFEQATDTAVKAFQKSIGLVPDGVVGAKTWAALCKIPRPYPPVGRIH